MTSMLDLVQTMHDIDRHKGRMCSECQFYRGWQHTGRGYRNCRKGYQPAGPTDSCDDFQSRADREARQLAAVVMSL